MHCSICCSSFILVTFLDLYIFDLCFIEKYVSDKITSMLIKHNTDYGLLCVLYEIRYENFFQANSNITLTPVILLMACEMKTLSIFTSGYDV